MSTIITHNVRLGVPAIHIYAPDARTNICNTDIVGHFIEITGSAENPFITCVRFINCTIVAENLRAFGSCRFEGCTMKIKDLNQ